MATKRKKSKSHTALGIEFRELIALRGVRAMLASGDLTMHHIREDSDLTMHHIREDSDDMGLRLMDSYTPKGGEHGFNMGCAMTYNSHCGTVGCIGGYMALVLGIDNDIYVDRNNQSRLTPLFFPPGEYAYRRITPKEAIKAIDNFLRTGRPNWKKALGNAKNKLERYG